MQPYLVAECGHDLFDEGLEGFEVEGRPHGEVQLLGAGVDDGEQAET